MWIFFFQAEDGIRDYKVTGVQTCALPIWSAVRMAKREKPPYQHLRLTDRIEPGVRVMLVGINPGVMSATSGHHFAGPTNRFWGLLYESGIVPEPITHEDDVRLPQWRIGMTNLVARPTPRLDTLAPR